MQESDLLRLVAKSYREYADTLDRKAEYIGTLDVESYQCLDECVTPKYDQHALVVHAAYSWVSLL